MNQPHRVQPERVEDVGEVVGLQLVLTAEQGERRDEVDPFGRLSFFVHKVEVRGDDLVEDVRGDELLRHGIVEILAVRVLAEPLPEFLEELVGDGSPTSSAVHSTECTLTISAATIRRAVLKSSSAFICG